MAMISQSCATFTGKTSYSFWSSSSNGVIRGITLKTSRIVKLGVRSKRNIITARFESGEPFGHANRELKKDIKKKGTEEPKQKVLEASEEVRKAEQTVVEGEDPSSSSNPLEHDVESLLETLLIEANYEYSKTVKTHELESEAIRLREQFLKSKSSDESRAIWKSLGKVMNELKQEQAMTPNDDIIKKKSDVLEKLDKAQELNKTRTEEVRETEQGIIEEKKEPSLPSDSELEAMKEMLEKEADREYDKAVRALGLKGKVSRLHEEFSKAESLSQRVAVMENLEKLEEEINKVLPTAPNYKVLKKKTRMVEELETAMQIRFEDSLKKELKTNLKMILDRPGMEEQYEELLDQIMKSKAESSAELDQSLKVKIAEWKKEIELAVLEILKSKALLSIEVREAKAKALTEKILYQRAFEDEVADVAKDVVATISSTGNSPELQPIIKLLEMEKKMYKISPDEEQRRRIEELDRKIEEMGMSMVNYPET